MEIIKKELIEDKLFIKIFGKKILSYNVKKAKIKNFKNRKFFRKRVLIVELNDCHHETLPGLCKCFSDLKYKIDLLVTFDKHDSFAKFRRKPYKIVFSIEEAKDLLQDPFLKKYDYIVFNSKVFYHEWKHPEIDILELLPNLQTGKYGNIYLQHHIDRINESDIKDQVVLANPSNNPELDSQILNTHYFGKKVKITAKNRDITNFIIVGGLNRKRKNHNLLVNAAQQLTENNYTNFKITVVGTGDLFDIPENIRQFFDMKGFLNFHDMYNELEKADYFLTLLDPELEAHQRYMSDGTSGSFQLIYGFLKPCIIHKTFGDVYGFTDKNALIYDSNDNMYKSMIKAIEQNNTQYKELQNNLKSDVIKLEKQSLNNLKKLTSKK